LVLSREPTCSGRGRRMAEESGTGKDYLWLDHYPEGVAWEAGIVPKALPAMLDESVRKHGSRPALDFMGREYSYQEFGDLVDRAAKGLQDLGVVKGSRVGLFFPNSPYAVIMYYAVLKAGGVVVNLNPLYAEQEVQKLVADSGAEFLATMNLVALYPKLSHALGDGGIKKVIICPMAEVLPFPKNLLYRLFRRGEVASFPDDDRHVTFKELTANDGSYSPVEVSPGEDVAVLQYTGGTTGLPKGAMLTHKNLYVNAEQCRRWFVDLDEGHETNLGVLPFFHSFGMTVSMNLGVLTGSRILLVPRFELEPVLKLIQDKRPTLFPGVPTMYTGINGYPQVGKYDLSSIKFCISGGAPLPLQVKKNFEALSGCALVEGYGLSETSPVATCNPMTGTSKEGSIGIPFPDTRIEIHSVEDPDQTVPQGERGEICIAGPQVMIGYWNRPEDTDEVFSGEFLRTGDVGYMDEEGYTFIVDRIKDLILAGGYNVYPRTVEEAIYQHPAVAEVTVIGIPDEYRGESPKAFISLREGQSLEEQELLDFLKDKLSKIEMPREIEFRDELPKTMIGKLSKKELVAEEKTKRGGQEAE